MKKLLILTVAAAATMFVGSVNTAQAEHCSSFGRSGISFGSSYRPSYGYSYRPSYSSYGYRPSYSSYGYRPSYSRGSSFGYSSRGFSISIGSGYRPSFYGGHRHSGHRH